MPYTDEQYQALHAAYREAVQQNLALSTRLDELETSAALPVVVSLGSADIPISIQLLL